MSDVEASEVLNTVNTIVVDDSAMMREAIAGLLATAPGCHVVAKGANGLDGLELARVHHPDLVVLDINMPVMGGLEALRLLKRELPQIEVVMVSSILDETLREHALGLGACACLEKGPELWKRLPAIVTELSRKCPAKT